MYTLILQNISIMFYDILAQAFQYYYITQSDRIIKSGKLTRIYKIILHVDIIVIASDQFILIVRLIIRKWRYLSIRFPLPSESPSADRKTGS